MATPRTAPPGTAEAAQYEETPDEVKALHDAARTGDMSALRAAAKLVEDVNQPHGETTAMHIAAGVGTSF
jgi:hypothetical protein